jgi:hypothetical protein
VLVRLSNTQALHAHGPEGSRFCALQNLATGAELTRSETQQNRLAGGSPPSAGQIPRHWYRFPRTNRERSQKHHPHGANPTPSPAEWPRPPAKTAN